MTRMVPHAAQLRTVIGFLVVLFAFEVVAQDRSIPLLFTSSSFEPNWLPVNGNVVDPPYSMQQSWTTQQTNTSAGNGTTYPSFSPQQIAQAEQHNSGSSTRSAKSGTGMDALPSFRGIKGIKNLPGGVGTLLMSNPHVAYSYAPSRGTDQGGTSLSIEGIDFQGAVPIHNEGADTFVLTGDMESTFIRTNAILPTSGQAFPKQFFNIALGVNYFHQFEGGTVGGVVFDVGSASNKPFESGRDILASGTGFLLIPHTEEGSWFVGVNASTNSQVLNGIPVPGGGYFFHPNDNFQAIVGLPFSVISWSPVPDWQLQFVYAFLTTVHSRVVYQPTDQWQLYSGFSWTNENWDRAERQNEKDHFFYYEKKFAAGFLWWFKPNMGLDIAAGYAFDRYFTELNGFKLIGDNTVRIDDGPYVSAQINLRF